MGVEGRNSTQRVEHRRLLRTSGIVLGVALGTLAFGLGLWSLFSNAQTQGNALRNQTQAITLQGAPPANPPADSLKDFVSSILADTEDVWRDQFRMTRQAYKEPHLVLFTGHVKSACGTASSAVGPSYCPLDEKIFVDLRFFQDMKDRYDATGDFAHAYIIAHEVGHHVQKLLGIREKALARQPGLGEDQNDLLSVRLELQADFLAGFWAHHADKARHILEPGDVDAVLRLLTAIGDDQLRPDARGDLDARSMTRCWDRRHGAAQQKVRWFRRGLETGDMSQGDTIDATEL